MARNRGPGAQRTCAVTIQSMGRVDQERLAAWREFLRAHATITQALEGELLRAHDLPLAWYDVLVSLNDAPHGRLRMQELARSVMFSRSGLTRLVDRMVHAGLLTREPCPGDRRGTFAVITSDGRKRLRAASGVHLRGVYEHFARHLDEHDVESLRAALDHVLAGEGDGQSVSVPASART
jgi:DNA-binding MarR family transcriptional regulator